MDDGFYPVEEKLGADFTKGNVLLVDVGGRLRARYRRAQGEVPRLSTERKTGVAGSGSNRKSGKESKAMDRCNGP